MNALSVITDKEKRKVWLRAFHIWQIRPHEVAPLSEATHECASCGTVYQGNFCPRCGQSANVGRFSFKKAFLLFLDVWGVGNRGMFRSIRDLVLRPGYMIRDYLRGMQSAYFPPFKMFFLLAALSFVVEHGFTMNDEQDKEDAKISLAQKTENVQETNEYTNVSEIDMEGDKGWKIDIDGKESPKDQKLVETVRSKIMMAEKVKDFLLSLRKKNSSLFSLFFLLLFFSPLYLFLRHAPSIPDFRFSEFVVALVYTSNAYSIYSIAGELLSFTILDFLAVLIVFVSFKQLSGYSKFRVLGSITLTFIMSFVLLVILFVAAILVLDFFKGG